MSRYIFVYGTLKRGGSNHALLAGQRFVGLARTQPRYKLYALSGFPGLVATNDNARSVAGEIWDVSDACLAELDRLEGTAEGIYTRGPIQLLPPHDSMSVEAYFYLLAVSGRTELDDSWPV